MRRAAKRDLTEPAIKKALEEAGALVLQLDKFDLLVCIYSHKTGKYRFVMGDCKSPGGKPTASQERLIAEGWPLRYWLTPQEALEDCGLG